MSPRFKVGDRVEHVRAKTVRGRVVGVTTQPDHHIGGWFYVIDVDAHPKPGGRPAVRDTFSERVLEREAEP